MLHHCNHGHAHAHDAVKADGWINMSMVGEYTASFISDAYWMTTLFDLCGGFSADLAGFSFYGMGFGALVALLSAGVQLIFTVR